MCAAIGVIINDDDDDDDDDNCKPLQAATDGELCTVLKMPQ